MFVCSFCFRFSHADHNDLEMIKIKCTFGKRWHHLHIVKRAMRYWYVNIILSCEICHHPLCIFDIMLCSSRINLSHRQRLQNPGAVMHIFVFLKTSLGQTQSQKKILTTDTIVYKKHGESVVVQLLSCFHLSDLQDGATRLFAKCSDQYWLIFSWMTLTMAVFSASGFVF